MPTSEEWDELIWEKAQAAKSARSLDKSIEERDISDLLEARGNASSTTSGALPARGLRFSKLIPPGGGGD